jgi:hypothetical protein
MTKTVMYSYLGTNGTICSPVHLEDIYYTRKIKIVADINKLITKDGINLFRQVMVPEDSANEWYEVDIPKGQE